MQKPDKYLRSKGITYLHYMAPMNNIPPIVALGIVSRNIFLQLDMQTRLRKWGHRSIGDPFVIARRDKKLCPLTDRPISDYVPLYFALHTPMQYVVTIRDKKIQQQDLVFIDVAPRHIFSIPGVVVTDGNAASDKTRFFQGSEGLEEVDWRIVLHVRKAYSTEYKRRKMAEVLVPDSVEPEAFCRIVVYNQQAKRDLKRSLSRWKQMLRDEKALAERLRRGLDIIEVNDNYYYSERDVPPSYAYSEDEDDIPF